MTFARGGAEVFPKRIILLRNMIKIITLCHAHGTRGVCLRGTARHFMQAGQEMGWRALVEAGFSHSISA
jgi:hypothetical protein